mmetsp:Transcript_34158/g.71910  ORF Transcript_34158/g.71910 Transcript_34158/m.71910 type:complete len:1204 (-) Transcript_34158:110-3721(-)|eukprot:CAMPEP_0183704334 /NCGR_PEP_ID=MMETSP0737-20130205/1689_1 /TAXON_ID=385413 /ORGANISM="Thalassiosira miniscula, Strain CCMP1093" /LENGTH=1203 /DNA_ID=CAMNT_0025931173 /DNA_START=208 /DNA_END=3819 /DNA_ORIENTATION=-
MRTSISTVTFSHFFLIGGAQAFANPFIHRRGTGIGRANCLENGSCSTSSLSVLKDLTDEETAAAELMAANGALVNSGTKVLADDPEFIKSLPEKRQYRVIQLPNKLTVLLASDPTTDVEAASVHVRAGHFDDLPNRAGLAHFHEHMLFLGTEKYPKEEEYEDYLGKFGGMSNAYTDMEDTNYYFNVSPLDHEDDGEGEDGDASSVTDALSGALDRFAQFFIAPLFDQSMLERELRAVNSEYLNGRTADNWRSFQLLKHGSSHDHPFSKFGCGNYNTLTDGGDATNKEEGNEDESDVAFGGGSSPREDLIKFWTEKYHAGNLRLCVVGRGSLDDLQKVVEDTFGPVRPPPANFVANGIVDQIEAGILKVPAEGESHLRDGSTGDFIFQTEHMTYSPNVAFGPDELGLIREVIPLQESRTLKIFSAVPPLDDPVLRESRPFRVLSHLVGHEAPGSLHHLLMEEGWINSLASGTGISSSDFCLANIAITLTPKGMQERDQVLAKTWQWFAAIKDAVMNDPHGIIEQYHNELKVITDTSFKYREMGDPTDFCSAAADRLFDYEPEKILLGSAEVGDYDVEVARAFLERLTPQNSLVVITGPELGDEECEKSIVSARDGSWQTEERYGAKYRQVRVPDTLAAEWNHPTEIDPRLRLPGLNEFIPEDLSLRCDDPEHKANYDPDFDYRKEHPKLLVDTPKLRMWHKMDRTFRVPKTSIRLQLTSPNIYRSPRTITLSRIFQKVLSDDLNSYVYDASVAGCNYRVSVVPSAYRLSVSGYSEKLPHLLDVVTSRIASLIEEMKEGDEAHPFLADIFHKAKDNLVRQTKNYIFESPYETGSYNLRMLLETPVWHVNDYIGEMEGPDAEAEPLTMKECAEIAEQCLFGRSKAVSLCIGNIDEKGSKEVAGVISDHFLKKRPLIDDETPRFHTLRMPNQAESSKIFGSPPEASEVPMIVEAVAHSESEENNSVELFMQTASSYELGYEGLAIQELIGSMAYNSAFNQLRTKEQLGYIVSAFVKKSTGGGNAFCVLVQSSNTLPPALEERCLKWVEQFRQEMEEMPEERFAMEAAAVRANLLEKDIKLSEEISSVWGEILMTVSHSEHFKNPVFDRVENFADVLTLDGNNGGGDRDDSKPGSSIKTAADLKKKALEFYDRYFMSPERRAVSSRVYNRKAKDIFDRNVGKPGVISSYDDARKVKQHLSALPTAPYW